MFLSRRASFWLAITYTSLGAINYIVAGRQCGHCGIRTGALEPLVGGLIASLPHFRLSMVVWVGLIVSELRYAYRQERISQLQPEYCANCEFDLRGNVSGICPECGLAIPNDKSLS